VTPQVRLGDGIEIDLDAGPTVVADASDPDGDVNVLSHAHGDHLYDGPPPELVCSPLTADLAAARRRDHLRPEAAAHPRVTLLEAGHVPGSRAALVEDDGSSVLYTGDVSTRDRFYLEGFDPVPADVLVVESTYGSPEYELPPQEEVEAAFVDFLDDTMDAPVVAFGYALGRAQELQLLGMRSDRETIYVTEAIDRINCVVEAGTDAAFDAELYDRDVTVEPGDLLILPSQTSTLSFVDDIVDESGAVRVGASGWGADSSFKYRGGFDETFAISDHCGFTELLDLVEAVDPEQVYTTHGFTDELATAIRSRLGYQAQSLRRNQTTLGDF
jgi:putative mRNA 3-end processing factor